MFLFVLNFFSMQKVLPRQSSSKEGQVVLIVLLVMSVILVVGLSIASRSVTDIKISQQSQEAARALWVAQAGLEEAMKSNRSIASSEEKKLSGVDYSVTKTGIGGAAEFVFPGNFGPDEPATLWLDGYAGSSLTFFWGKEIPPVFSDTTPALEATLIYKAGVNYLTKRYVYDPYQNRSTKTNFNDVVFGGSCGDTNFAFNSGAINIPASSYLVRLKLLFNDTAQPIGVRGNAVLPPQGNCFDSTATVPESGVSRKLRQCQLYSTTPPIFDNVLFSGSNIQ